jgi:hypothetical protein
MSTNTQTHITIYLTHTHTHTHTQEERRIAVYPKPDEDLEKYFYQSAASQTLISQIEAIQDEQARLEKTE